MHGQPHILCSVTFFFFENPAVYEIMWQNIVEPDRPQMTVWDMHVACWIPKATNTHSEYVILIAFPLQKNCYTNAPEYYVDTCLPYWVYLRTVGWAALVISPPPTPTCVSCSFSSSSSTSWYRLVFAKLYIAAEPSWF